MSLYLEAREAFFHQMIIEEAKIGVGGSLEVRERNSDVG
jgi:hypothetical protein